MADNKKPPTLKPMPKPVRLGAHKTKPVYIDPDDFDLDSPSRRGRPRKASDGLQRGARSKPEPTLAEAALFFIGRKIGAGGRRRRRRKQGPHLNYTKVAGVFSLSAVLIALVVLSVNAMVRKNALTVSLDDKVVGHIALTNDINESTIQGQAVARLEDSLGASVRVNQVVSIQPARVSSKDIQPFSDVLDQVSRAFTYKIAAVAILVDGAEVVVLRTQAEADMVAERLQDPYKNENTTFAEFLAPWECVEKLADEDDLGLPEDALLKLDKKTRVMEEYTVASGDTLGGIATRNGTTVDKICADNPPMTANTVIKVGQAIKLEAVKPYMSVRTIDESTRTEVLPAQTEERPNAMQPVNYSNVINEGRDGEQVTTVRVTRVNGVQTGPEEVVKTSVTIEPIKRVVEVGTAEAQPNRR